jgi:hypothetical protein
MASSAVSDSGESFSETTAVSHSTGDTVHLRSPSGSKDHFVGRITRMWVDEMDEEMCECAWYFRHSDIAVGAGSIQPLGKDEVRLTEQRERVPPPPAAPGGTRRPACSPRIMPAVGSERAPSAGWFAHRVWCVHPRMCGGCTFFSLQLKEGGDCTATPFAPPLPPSEPLACVRFRPLISTS